MSIIYGISSAKRSYLLTLGSKLKIAPHLTYRLNPIPVHSQFANHLELLYFPGYLYISVPESLQIASRRCTSFRVRTILRTSVDRCTHFAYRRVLLQVREPSPQFKNWWKKIMNCCISLQTDAESSHLGKDDVKGSSSPVYLKTRWCELCYDRWFTLVCDLDTD